MSYFLFTALVLLFAIFKVLHDILNVLKDMEFEVRREEKKVESAHKETT